MKVVTFFTVFGTWNQQIMKKAMIFIIFVIYICKNSETLFRLVENTQHTELTELSEEEAGPPPRRGRFMQNWHTVFRAIRMPFPYICTASFADWGPLRSRQDAAIALNRGIHMPGLVFVAFEPDRTLSFLYALPQHIVTVMSCVII